MYTDCTYAYAVVALFTAFIYSHNEINCCLSGCWYYMWLISILLTNHQTIFEVDGFNFVFRWHVQVRFIKSTYKRMTVSVIAVLVDPSLTRPKRNIRGSALHRVWYQSWRSGEWCWCAGTAIRIRNTNLTETPTINQNSEANPHKMYLSWNSSATYPSFYATVSAPSLYLPLCIPAASLSSCLSAPTTLYVGDWHQHGIKKKDLSFVAKTCNQSLSLSTNT